MSFFFYRSLYRTNWNEYHIGNTRIHFLSFLFLLFLILIYAFSVGYLPLVQFSIFGLHIALFLSPILFYSIKSRITVIRFGIPYLITSLFSFQCSYFHRFFSTFRVSLSFLQAFSLLRNISPAFKLLLLFPVVKICFFFLHELLVNLHKFFTVPSFCDLLSLSYYLQGTEEIPLT